MELGDEDGESSFGVIGVLPGIDSVELSSLRPPKKEKESWYEGSTLREIGSFGGYQTYRPPGFLDPWVRVSLKQFSRQLYDSLYGFTRRGDGLRGQYASLFKFDGIRSEFSDLSHDRQRLMKKAIARTRDAFRLPHKFQPLDWHEIGQHMRTDTAAGITFPGKKKGDVMEEIYNEGRWLGHRVKNAVGVNLLFNPKRVRFPPCMAGLRGHLSPRDSPKTRLVWVYPAELLMLEGHYAPMLYQQYASLPNGPLLTGKPAQRLFTEWGLHQRCGDYLHGLDFSSFDTTVPSWLIRVAFDILRQNVDFENWGNEVVPESDRKKWSRVWDACVWYFINTPILMPDGRMFRKYRGIPSGSWFTQLVGSVICYILNLYLSSCQDLDVLNLKVLGDDSCFRAGEKMDLEQASLDASVLGMVLSTEKSDVVTEPSEFKLLGTRYVNGRQYRPDEEWFKLALYPENPPADVQTSLTRLVGLWLGGAMWSLEFTRFFEYFQTCFECPRDGWFSKDTRRWLEVIHGGKAPRGWTSSKSLFWKSIFYVM